MGKAELRAFQGGNKGLCSLDSLFSKTNFTPKIVNPITFRADIFVIFQGTGAGKGGTESGVR